MKTDFIPTTGTIDIYSSIGVYTVNVEDGKVVSKQLETGAPEEYKRTRRFDLEEAKKNGLDSFDILNFGYWYEKQGQKKYEYVEPANDWRKMMVDNGYAIPS